MSSSTRAAPVAVPPHQLAPTSEQLRNAAFFVQSQWHSRQYPKPTFPRVPEDVRDGVVKTLRSTAWSMTGRHIAVGKEFKEIKVFDGTRVPLDTKTAVALSMQAHNGHISALAFSPVDENILASGCRSASSGGIIAIWDVTQPEKPLATFTVGDVMTISFHPSGRQVLASHSRSGRDEVSVFHLVNEDGQDIWKERDDVTLTSRTGGTYEEMNGVRFINSGRAICGVSNDGSVRAWKFPVEPVPLSPEPVVQDIEETMEDEEVEEASRKSTPREGTPDAEEEATETAVKEGEAEETAKEDGEQDDAVEEAKTGDGAAKEPIEESTELVDVVEGATPADEKAIDSTAEPGEGLAIEDQPSKAEEGGDVEMEDPSDTKPTETIEETTAVTETTMETPATADVEMAEAGAVTPTAASVPPSRHPSPPPAASKKRKLEVQKSKARQMSRIRHIVQSPASLQSIALDPTGRHAAVAGPDAVVRLLDMRNWICQRTFNDSLGGIKQLSFSHDGELLAFGGDDQSVYIVSVVNGDLIAKYDSRAIINSLQWHPTRNWLAWTTSLKGTSQVTAPLFIARVE